MKSLPLRTLQRWLAGIVEHPATADVAMRSRPVDRLVPRRVVEAGAVVRRNPRMSAAEMLQVYNGGYLARLVEVLQGDYGAVQHALGEAAFHDLVARYLQAFPSRHPNLNQLGRSLPRFLARQRLPHRAFLVELARLELAVSTAFDAPESTPLDPGVLATVPPERWDHARFTASPSLQLLVTRFPTDVYYQGWKEGAAPARPPAPVRSWLAVFRRDDRVWRQRLTQSSFAVLSALVAGAPLGRALRAARAGEPVGEWFQGFARDGLFTAVEFRLRPRPRRG